MIWNLPNCLTLARILAAPVVCLMVVLGPPETALWAFLLFALAALTDFFDGWLARRLGQISEIGKMLDPIADKVMVTLVIAALIAGPGGTSPWYLVPALLILMREILISGLREFLGDVKLPTTQLAKWKTTVQMVALGALLLVPAVMAGDTISSQETPGDSAGHIVWGVGIALLWLAALLTVITGWDYFQKGLAYIQGREGRK